MKILRYFIPIGLFVLFQFTNNCSANPIPVYSEQTIPTSVSIILTVIINLSINAMIFMFALMLFYKTDSTFWTKINKSLFPKLMISVLFVTIIGGFIDRFIVFYNVEESYLRFTESEIIIIYPDITMWTLGLILIFLSFIFASKRFFKFNLMLSIIIGIIAIPINLSSWFFIAGSIMNNLDYSLYLFLLEISYFGMIVLLLVFLRWYKRNVAKIIKRSPSSLVS